MSLDIDRIWHRNLGRDDRVTSRHAKDMRYPFLDSHIWSALAGLDLNQVTDPATASKFIIRDTLTQLEFPDLASTKKTAIQFGTRIAKLCNVSELGSNRKAKGWAKIREESGDTFAEELEKSTMLIQTMIDKNEGDIPVLKDTLKKLSSSEYKVAAKRHLMRVVLGDMFHK